MSPDDRFRRVYAGNFEALLAYASRRVEQPDDAADVVAETFLVAWRRSADLPPDDEIRLWLYGGPAGCWRTTTAAGSAASGWASGSGNA